MTVKTRFETLALQPACARRRCDGVTLPPVCSRGDTLAACCGCPVLVATMPRPTAMREGTQEPRAHGRRAGWQGCPLVSWLGFVQEVCRALTHLLCDGQPEQS